MAAKQHRLFDDDPTPWTEDDQAEQQVATVVFPSGLAGEFDYRIPDELLDDVEPGRRVQVPLGRGNRKMSAYCTATTMKPSGGRRLKDILAVVDPVRLISPSMLRLTKWISDHYLCPWGQVLETVVPSGVRAGAGTRLTTLLRPAPDLKERLTKTKLTKKQALVLQVLKQAGEPLTPNDLARGAKCTQAPINLMRRRGLLRSENVRLQKQRAPEKTPEREMPLDLNPDQALALEAICQGIDQGHHETLLVHGVTGSGKTEVYIQAIERIVSFGRQAIVLVPEISLTPQTVARFRCRFDEVAVLHSHLTDADRHWQWQRIASGRVQVVVGARSAIFAPVPNLGLIVLDEEHESSFKQDTAPRYHARSVAIERSAAEDVPLVLGSATPSLESWHRAVEGEYRLVSMPRRVMNRPLPAVGTVDLRDASGSRYSRGAIHRQLHSAMREALRDDGQIILLLNRRGFSTHIQCPACGNVVQCPECEISLTHHRTEEVALCHYCDYQIPTPNKCPDCGFAGIRYSGLGTQKLEAEVKARFRGVPCLRMDTDTMRGRGSHERALSAFREGKVKILLGTQMIAKGLDFPNVTLVGVINADTALHLPDFRAAERTFHLVTQVAGRTGRGEKGGHVLIQTFNPDHIAIQAAAGHDYARFAAHELPMRKMLAYPPYTSMARLVVRGPVEAKAEQFAAHLAERIESTLKDEQVVARILGPAPAPFAKLRGRYRFQLQVQGADGDGLRRSIRIATQDLSPPEDVQWIVDIDPLDML